MTLQEIKKNNSITTSESIVLDCLNEMLCGNFGELYSNVGCSDIAHSTKINLESVKGVVGSLVKKGILSTCNPGTGYDVVYFADQENMY